MFIAISFSNYLLNNGILWRCWHISEAVAQRCSVRKGVLRNFPKFTGKHLCQSLFFNKAAGLVGSFLFFFQTDDFVIYSVSLKYHAVDYFLRESFSFFNKKICFQIFISVNNPENNDIKRFLKWDISANACCDVTSFLDTIKIIL